MVVVCASAEAEKMPQGHETSLTLIIKYVVILVIAFLLRQCNSILKNSCCRRNVRAFCKCQCERARSLKTLWILRLCLAKTTHSFFSKLVAGVVIESQPCPVRPA